MVSKEQLKFLLGEIQAMQKNNIGTTIAISISTAYKSYGFVVIIDHNAKKDENGEISAEISDFVFDEQMTEDQCLDRFSDIEEIIKREKKKNEL